MLKIPVVIWIANAAARLAGTHGDLTRQAATADGSRQTVDDHAQKVPAAVEAEHSGGPTRAEVLEQNQHLPRENAQLWDGLAQTIAFPKDQPRQFTVIATTLQESWSRAGSKPITKNGRRPTSPAPSLKGRNDRLSYAPPVVDGRTPRSPLRAECADPAWRRGVFLRDLRRGDSVRSGFCCAVVCRRPDVSPGSNRSVTSSS